MMDKYTLLQKIGIYSSLALFILFMLLPFVEMFIASLRPLTHLFSRPDVPVGETMTFMDFMSRFYSCLLYTSPSPRDKRQSRMPSSA